MKTDSSLRRIIIAAAAVAVALVLLPAARAAEAKALPVITAIAKGEPGPDYGGPYTLTVTNTDAKELKLKAVVAQSVISHNRPKTIELPEHAVAAGGSWKIADLAAADKVTLSAEGHAPLTVTVEAAK